VLVPLEPTAQLNARTRDATWLLDVATAVLATAVTQSSRRCEHPCPDGATAVRAPANSGCTVSGVAGAQVVRRPSHEACAGPPRRSPEGSRYPRSPLSEPLRIGQARLKSELDGAGRTIRVGTQRPARARSANQTGPSAARTARIYPPRDRLSARARGQSLVIGHGRHDAGLERLDRDHVFHPDAHRMAGQTLVLAMTI